MGYLAPSSASVPGRSAITSGPPRRPYRLDPRPRGAFWLLAIWTQGYCRPRAGWATRRELPAIARGHVHAPASPGAAGRLQALRSGEEQDRPRPCRCLGPAGRPWPVARQSWIATRRADRERRSIESGPSRSGTRREGPIQQFAGDIVELGRIPETEVAQERTQGRRSLGPEPEGRPPC